MRILVVSNIEWSDNNAFGNTISNWFSNIPNVEFASIYRRSTLPNNTICSKYYSITPITIIRNYFSSEKIGCQFECNQNQRITIKQRQNSLEKKLIHYFHVFGTRLLPSIEDVLFKTNKWKNKRYIRFVKEFNPDIVFSFITSSNAGLQIVESIKNIVPSCIYIGFIADDVLGVSESKGKKTITSFIKIADKIYGCSEILCKEYSKRYNVNITPLYKGCNFTNNVKIKKNKIKIIAYAGNLHYGRLDTLEELAKCIEEHNKIYPTKIELNVYTNEILSNAQQESLNIEGASKLCGPRPYEEIKKLLNMADVTLHAESFLEKNIQVVRYSFSTKIIDCLQSNSVLFAIGPNNIASIDFASKVPGAFVASELSQIPTILKQISTDDLFIRFQEMRKFAVENFDIKNIQNKLLSDFHELMDK